MHEDLLRLPREHPPSRAAIDGATAGPGGFVPVNLDPNCNSNRPPSPCWRTSRDLGWGLIWSIVDPRYGGGGVPAIAFDGDDAWHIPGRSADVLEPRDLGPATR